MYRAYVTPTVPLLLGLLCACSSSGQVTLPTDSTALAANLPSAQTMQASNSATLIQIDSGSSTAAGSWSPDSSYVNGWSGSTTATVDTQGVANPAPMAVYQTQRTGVAFSYTLSHLTAGLTYMLRLHFAETWFNSSDLRKFNVTINGSQVLKNFDIFAVAGGKNIAIAQAFPAKASSLGVITIAFTATINNAIVGGIELASSSTSGGTSSPAPSPGPTSGYPIYSSYFVGNTPFHHQVSTLTTTPLSPTIVSHYWAEGIGQNFPTRQSGSEGPLYLAQQGDPTYRFDCPAYGVCNAAGITIHLPSGAYAQTGSDHHLNSFDPTFLHGEVDGWGGLGTNACTLHAGSPGTEACSWGGFFPFSGTGLATSDSSANAGGYAFGLMDISAQEMLNGHIDHALGITQSCLDDGGVYPSIVGRTSDSHCPDALEPNAHYGNLIHIKSGVNIMTLGYSHYCQVIVQALQNYGAYTSDTNGSSGLQLDMEQMNTYPDATNPWYTKIFPSLVAGGDGGGTGANFYFETCLNRIPATDIEVLQVSPTLP